MKDENEEKPKLPSKDDSSKPKAKDYGLPPAAGSDNSLAALGAVAPGGKYGGSTFSNTFSKLKSTSGLGGGGGSAGSDSGNGSGNANGTTSTTIRKSSGLHYSVAKSTTSGTGGSKNGDSGGGGRSWKRDLTGDAASFMSGKSRRSKWGDDDAEPLGAVNQRKWEDVSFGFCCFGLICFELGRHLRGCEVIHMRGTT